MAAGAPQSAAILLLLSLFLALALRDQRSSSSCEWPRAGFAIHSDDMPPRGSAAVKTSILNDLGRTQEVCLKTLSLNQVA